MVNTNANLAEAQIQIARSRLALAKYDESQHPRDDNGMWSATGVSVSRLSSGNAGSKADPFGDAKFRSVTGSLPVLGADRNPQVASIIATEEEKKKDEANAAVLMSLMSVLIDANQTRMISDKPGQYREVNSARLIGEHPTGSAVNLMFAAQTFAQALLPYLPPQIRGPIALGQLLQRLPAIVNNAALGLK